MNAHEPAPDANDDARWDIVPLILRGAAAPTGRTLEVHQVWGTTLLASRQFAPGHGPVRIGLEPGQRWRFLGVDMGFAPSAVAALLPWVAPLWSEVEGGWRTDFAVDASVLPDDGAWTLFDVAPDGAIHARVADGWDGFVERDGERLGFAALAERGLAEAEPGGWRLPLPEGATLVVECAGSVFAARRVTPAPRVRLTHSEEPDRLFAGVMAVGACLFLAAVALSWTLPPARSAAQRDLAPELVELLLDVPETPPTVEVVKRGGERSRKARGDEGGSGRPSKAPGPPPRSDRAVAQSAGLLSVLEDDRFADLLGSSSLGAGITGGVAGLIGSTGGGPGGAGLGARGDGLGAGGDADSLGAIDTEGGGVYGRPGGPGKQDGVIGPASREAVVLGPLDRSLIDEVVKRNTPALRYCYQRELQRQPTLGGKVVVKFTIAGDGSVSTASTRSSTLASDAVEQCLVGRFLRMDFPEPKAGGTVVVSYPFLFSAG